MKRRLILAALSVGAVSVVLAAAPGSASAQSKSCGSGGAGGFGNVYTPAACQFKIKCTTAPPADICDARVSMGVRADFAPGHPNAGTIKGTGISQTIPTGQPHLLQPPEGRPLPRQITMSCSTPYGIYYATCSRTWDHTLYNGEELVVSCRAPSGALAPVVRWVTPYVSCEARFMRY